MASQINFKSWQQHSCRLLPAKRLANTYICSLLMDEHVIRTHWHQLSSTHSLSLVTQVGWKHFSETDFCWKMAICWMQNISPETWRGLMNSWQTRCDSLTLLSRHSSFPLLPGLGSEETSCARDLRFAATAWESKSPEGCRSTQGSLENLALAKAFSTFQSPAELRSRSWGSWCRHHSAPG